MILQTNSINWGDLLNKGFEWVQDRISKSGAPMPSPSESGGFETKQGVPTWAIVAGGLLLVFVLFKKKIKF